MGTTQQTPNATWDAAFFLAAPLDRTTDRRGLAGPCSPGRSASGPGDSEGTSQPEGRLQIGPPRRSRFLVPGLRSQLAPGPAGTFTRGVGPDIPGHARVPRSRSPANTPGLLSGSAVDY